MDIMGEFYEVEKDGKSIMLYYHLKYHPIPQTQNSAFSGERSNHKILFQPLFLCPTRRWLNQFRTETSSTFSLKSSPEYVLSTRSVDEHHVLPLFWCNNKEFDVNGGCQVCHDSNFGTDYYFCNICYDIYHQECVESPLKIKHPYHLKHALQLYFYDDFGVVKCLCCGRKARGLVYCCSICQAFMHPICAMKPVLIILDQTKRHDHPLTYFPRQTSLTCNVCGLLRKNYPTYICVRCNFVSHNDCMYSPHIIKISRHHHRISYTCFLRFGKWSCGVCRQNIDGDHGAYTCNQCSDYVVHSRCALEKDLWDGVELKGIPEEDDIIYDDASFNMISDGVILHFLHEHHLLLEINILYQDYKYCQACVLPICEGNIYSCMKCDFVLHETCANAPRIIQHAFHRHPLTLKVTSGYDKHSFRCEACVRDCGGFVYQCLTKDCYFNLDVRCASICEPFDYISHEHPLFLALDTAEIHICHICKFKCYIQLNCIKCDFIVCIKCATLPYNARHKHDDHFLTILSGKEVFENAYCEVCELDLRDTLTKVFYWCKECCTGFHTKCLFGENLYLKPGQLLEINGKDFQVFRKISLCRPFCDFCKNRCENEIYKRDNGITCSLRCSYSIN